MAETSQLKIRPYARLLTMLGEQLIKNERIALIEIIKNSYDADADWVKVTFHDFGNDFKITPESKIVIADNGCGMNSDIIKDHWLNPATPVKKRRKVKKDTTGKGRIIQGEKGIGRFSILKLGRKIKITTRAEYENIEHVLDYDFSIYDDDFLSEKGEDKDLFIDDLDVLLTTREPVCFIEKVVSLGARKVNASKHGTIIEISNLKGSWSEKKINEIQRDISRMESIFYEEDSNVIRNESDFQVFIYKDSEQQNYHEKYLEEFNRLLDEQAVIHIKNGYFDSVNNDLIFSIKVPGKINFIEQKINLRDSELSGLKVYRDYFTYKDEGNKKNQKNYLDERKIECGSFHFSFYVFDFDRAEKVSLKYRLDDDERKIIKDHRVYLYRDNVRVFPYGEPQDDWLQIDTYRGTIAAGHFLSNDQVVGNVKITNKGNPKLIDKTNREGLIDQDNATADFITILKIFLAYIRQKPYARYRKNLISKNDQDIFKTKQVQDDFTKLKEIVGENTKAQKLISKAEKEYKAERDYLIRRAETTEELAGVGLSVETASHDIMGIMGKVFSNLDGLIQDLMSKDEIDRDELIKELQSIRGGMGFIEAQLKDIQMLFKSSKQRRKNIRVKIIAEKVERIYRRLLKKESINFSIRTYGSPLVAKTTDAVLLQLLLNLFDNSIYWLQPESKSDKKIEVILDGNKGEMIFSDNGPGIDKNDAPYIFDSFYSGKGIEGRGLGLYIARQLLERNDYSIELAELQSEKVMSGANFIVNFVEEAK